MARQAAAVLALVLVFTAFESPSFGPTKKIAQQLGVDPSWHSASPYLAASFVLVALGMALTSGASIDITADRIARTVGRTRVKHQKQVLIGLSVQLGLGSILIAVLALRMPSEIAAILRCVSNPICDAIWAAVLSVAAAGCGASAYAIAKASTIVSNQS